MSPNNSSLSQPVAGGGIVGNCTASVYDLPATVTIATLSVAASVITILGNILVVTAFSLERKLRVVSNYFIVSLAVTDLLIGLFSMNLYTAYLLLGCWPLGSLLCDLWLSLDYTACLTSQCTVLSITVDRFCSVHIPSLYRTWRTHSKVIAMVAVAWLAPSLLFFSAILGWPLIARHQDRQQRLKEQFMLKQQVSRTGRDELSCFAEFTTWPVFNTLLTVGYFWIPLFIMLFLYCGIYRVACRLQKKSDERHKKMNTLMAMAGQTMSRIGVGVKWPGPDSDIGASTIAAPEPRQAEAANISVRYCPSGADQQHQQCPPSSPVRLDAAPEDIKALSYIDDIVAPDADAAAVVSSDDCGGGGEMHKLCAVVLQPDGKKTTIQILDSDKSHPPRLKKTKQKTVKTETVRYCAAAAMEPNNSSSSANNTDNNNNSTTTMEMSSPPLSPASNISTALIDVLKRPYYSKMIRRSSRAPSAVSRSENRAQKAFRTISLILGAFLACWTPYHVLVVIKGFCDDLATNQSCVNDYLYSVSYWLCYMNSPINPFCYALANVQFKKTFLRLLRGNVHRC